MDKVQVEEMQEARHNFIPEETKLSPRQKVVWGLMARGMLDKEIAVKLGIGVNTVKNHCSHVYHRLGVRNRVEASLKFLEFNKGRWCKLKPLLFCQEGYCLECEIGMNYLSNERKICSRN